MHLYVTKMCRVSIWLFKLREFIVRLGGVLESRFFSLGTSRSSPPHHLICGAGWSMTFEEGSLWCFISRSLCSIAIMLVVHISR